VNNLSVVGNLVADPDLRYTQSGIAQVSFRIGINRRYQSGGEWKQETTFLPCVCWADLAEAVAKELSKGQRVMVHGRLAQREYEGKDGQKRTITEIAVEEIGPSLKSARKAESQPKVSAQRFDDDDAF
jgi:single-strand DNA-binding protein